MMKEILYKGKCFVLGIFVGITAAVILVGLNLLQTKSVLPVHIQASHEEFDKIVDDESFKGIHQIEDQHLHRDDDTTASMLKQKVRVLVWVMTSPNNLKTKAKAVKETWGRRCDQIYFFSSRDNAEFPAIGLSVQEGREHLTMKTMKAFRYVYDKHFNDADWFMKVDDDTYVIMENLRYFLSSKSPNEPVFYGQHFKTILKQGFYSGGAGYVLSKEALRRFGKNWANCTQDGAMEDVDLASCMEKLGVRTANSTDSLGRSRFHCFSPETHLSGNYQGWYYKYDSYGAKKSVLTDQKQFIYENIGFHLGSVLKQEEIERTRKLRDCENFPLGPESISDYSVTFHYVTPSKMYELDLFIYHIRPYGIRSLEQDLN